jgi:hypothetical protein
MALIMRYHKLPFHELLEMSIIAKTLTIFSHDRIHQYRELFNMKNISDYWIIRQKPEQQNLERQNIDKPLTL